MELTAGYTHGPHIMEINNTNTPQVLDPSVISYVIKQPIVISQTPKHVRDMFNFNMTSNPCGYLVLFVSKTPSVVWYFIMNLIPPKVRSYFALF